MKLHHLRDVVAIAERGGLRAASRHLNLAQAALTRSLGEIERELGASLFDRHARGMTCTETGQAFVKRATSILHEMRRARDEVHQMQGGTGGSVAAALSIAPHIAMLPSALRAFRTRFRDTRLCLSEGTFPMHEAGLRNGGIDFYIGPGPGQPLPPDLVARDLFKNTRAVLCRQDHPLAEARSIVNLADADWATTSITIEAEKELGDLFEKHGMAPPRLALQSQSALTLIVTLAHTDFLAMVPVQWMDFAPTLGILKAIPLKEVLPAPTIVLICRAGLPMTPAATHLADLLSRAAPAMAARDRHGRAR